MTNVTKMLNEKEIVFYNVPRLGENILRCLNFSLSEQMKKSTYLPIYVQNIIISTQRFRKKYFQQTDSSTFWNQPEQLIQINKDSI